MAINWTRGITAGLIGAAVMTAIMVLLRALGVTSMNLELMLGSMVTSDLGFGSWTLGLFLHLLAGGMFGAAYGWIMEILGRSGVGVGLGIASVHTVLSGLFMPALGAIHPLVHAGTLPAPGVFASSMGAVGVGLFVLLHLMFGLIVGAYYIVISNVPEYGRPKTASRRPPTVLHRS